MPTIAASPLKVMTDHLLAIRRLCKRRCGAEEYGLKSPAVSSGTLPLRPLAPLTTLPRSHDGQWPGITPVASRVATGSHGRVVVHSRRVNRLTFTAGV